LKSAGLEINCTKIAEMKRTTKALVVNALVVKNVLKVLVVEAHEIGTASKFR